MTGLIQFLPALPRSWFGFMSPKGAGTHGIFQLTISLQFLQALTISHYVILTKINEGE